ncbi:MAG TPA: HAMP domain-containing sensor histidine kinase [Saprospiraceae bacterium]|jgi:signal transduction histidine kinase|nr:HAMP domain-containing histidine kinase [Saprospiraceae bacterium]HOJ89712.1 HAMP domain-containing sensor histidine kinase [Saprospiraceae bacterium]HUN15372.1 HAMP domain-containing sensor histidine kinase [Saprospiraceae bacterium]
MDNYSKAGKWKIILGLIGVIFLIIPWFYTNYLATKLEEGERAKVEIFAKTLEEVVNNEDLNADFTYQYEILEKFKDIPMIAIDEEGKVKEVFNIDELTDTLEMVQSFKKTGIAPIEGFGYARYIYYKHPYILTLLSYFPWVQLFLLLIYILIGYAVFSASRREEQNRVWVGMAKETAHQLGTPISGIMGWIENLKMNLDPNESDQTEIIYEMERDVNKLQQVADRFSKIGSVPDLHKRSLIEELLVCKNYIEARASRNVVFDFPESSPAQFYSMINTNLFHWVIENLLRNALDAMDGKGVIKFQVSQEQVGVNKISIQDTGKGIPASKVKTIFKPGYTTKERGWGLGLSLSKRIIENYHKGKIYVSYSELDKGTCFVIELPAVN